MVLISASVNIPRRILEGSERGELASSQDQDEWASVIEGRRTDFAEPLLREVIARLQLFDLLPETADGYSVEWPNPIPVHPKEEADIRKATAETMQILSPAGAIDSTFTRAERREVLGYRAEPESEEELVEIPEAEAEEAFRALKAKGKRDTFLRRLIRGEFR